MKKRQRPRRSDPDALYIFWRGFWSALEERTETGRTMPTIPLGVPVFTVSVTTTVLSTTFVTVPFESGLPTGLEESSSGRLRSATRTDSSNSILIPTLTTESSSLSAVTTGLDTVLPPIVTASSQIVLPPIASASPSATSPASSAANETSNSMIGMDSQSDSQKKAVVGGLSGTIAGLIFIGVIICLILRMRRRKHPPKKAAFDAASEKDVRPAFLRTWTGLTFTDRPRTGGHPRPSSVTTTSVTVDEDHRIIRMNTRHWPRPFAPGAGEGYRDSVPHGQLRVMNPDLSSRPITPRRSTDTPSSFLRKQREVLTGFVFGGSVPRSSQSMQRERERVEVPTITVVDPTLSRECIAPYARTLSFKSYPSFNTLPVVRQEPPEDPFVTPPVGTSDNNHQQPQPQPQPPEPSHQRLRRPSLSSLQTTATRTWSHLLHPFRHNNSIPTPIQNVRGASHFSVSTSASNSNSSYRRSDPFDLSVRGGASRHPSIAASPRMGSEFARRESGNPGWILYEGT